MSNKKKRNEAKNQKKKQAIAAHKQFFAHRAKVTRITQSLNHALGKFYIIGDKNHLPMTFGLCELKNRLKGEDLKIGLEEAMKFLLDTPNTWMIAIYHFFDIDGIVEVIPVTCTVPDFTLGIACDLVPALIEETKVCILETEEYKDLKDYYSHHGYYINYGNDLNFDKMDGDLINAMFTVSKDLQMTSDNIPEVNGYKVLDNILKDPSEVTGSSESVPLCSNMVELTEEMLNSFILNKEESVDELDELFSGIMGEELDESVAVECS